ncbi:MAG: hypothetical protein WC002_10435 [Candidatus Muiribacteriota bacterium]
MNLVIALVVSFTFLIALAYSIVSTIFILIDNIFGKKHAVLAVKAEKIIE